MSSTPAARMFDVRHVQLARALFAAVAAVMVTFSPDHSARVGLAVFSGFALANALVFLLSAFLVHPAGHRWDAVLLGVLTGVAGMIAGLVGLRSTTLFFVLVIAWALATGLVELISGLVDRARLAGAARTDARDAITVGALTIVLGLALLFVAPDYSLGYAIEDGAVSREFTLTGITIAVGVFGGYAAIVAVYLAIAGLSPRRPESDADDAAVPDAASVTDTTTEGAA